MKILDDKINSIYKFCKFFGNEQQKQAKSLEKLVALDDLSDAFWAVSYLKKPMILIFFKTISKLFSL